MGNPTPPLKDRMTHAVLFQVENEPGRFYTDPAGAHPSDATPDALAEEGFFEVADEPVRDPGHPTVVRKLTFARIDTPG